MNMYTQTHVQVYVQYRDVHVLVISCPCVLQQKYSAYSWRVKPKVISTAFFCCSTPGQDIANLYPGNQSLLTVGVYSLI